jgi:UPF0755 protein
MRSSKTRFLKPWWIGLFLLIVFFLIRYSLFSSWFEFNEKITIEKWDTIEKFTTEMSVLSSFKVRRYLKNHSSDLKSLQLWSYNFSGSYTPQSFITSLNNWPTRAFTKITLLEWWSIYDIDEYLSKEWYIDQWQYINYVSDSNIIDSLGKKYPFLTEFIATKPDHKIPISLEWILYPDTYHININQPILPQLVNLQLQAFDDKVNEPLWNQIKSFSSRLKNEWYSFSLGLYNIITMASIIEKEERADKNKSLIAGIFLNRIQKNMRIDADITLCYGLKKWYETCTPTIIVNSINDESNIYNTRKQYGLTPTPISNPSVMTIKSLLEFKNTTNIYYLHDDKGRIWPADDLAWHNTNKSNHL